MYDDVRRPDVLVNAEKTQVVQKRGVCVTHRRVVWTQHDVMHHVRYRVTLRIIHIKRQSLYLISQMARQQTVLSRDGHGSLCFHPTEAYRPKPTSHVSTWTQSLNSQTK